MKTRNNVQNMVLIIAIGLIFMILLGACAKATTEAPEAAPTAVTTEEVAPPPTEEVVAPEEPIQIAFFAPQANSYVAASYKGITEVAEREGAEVTFFDTGFDATKEYNQIQDAITQGKFDAFIIIPLDQMLLIPVVEEAIAQGIQVVNTDLALGPDPDSFCPQVEGQAGSVLITPSQRADFRWQQIPEVCKDLDPCNIGWVGTISTIDYEKQLVAGFPELEAQYPNIHFVAFQETGGYSAEGAIPVAQNMLLAHPEINVMSVSGEQLMFGVEQAVQEAGRTDIRLISQGATCNGFKGIEEGRWYSTTLDAPYTEGKAGAEVAIKAVRGELDEPACVSTAEEAGAGPVFFKDNLDTFQCEFDG
jgi:ribose transport system substrate-binding protein